MSSLEKKPARRSFLNLVLPRLVAIDSSLLASWAADASSANSEVRALARSAQTQLLERNWAPIICLHHFIELARHSDLQKVADRISFLKSFPHLAWISRSYGSKIYGPKLLGGIVDVFEAEVWAIDASPDITIPDLRAAVKKRIVQYGDPSEITILDEWRDLHPTLQAMAVFDQQLTSIARAHDYTNRDSKISQLRGRQTMQVSSQRPTLDEIKRLETNLNSRGDPRLSAPHQTAQGFLEMVGRDLVQILNRGGSAFDAFIEHHDIPKSDISEDTTVRQFTKLAKLRKHVRVATKQLGLDLNQTWPKIRAAKIPSEIIQENIRAARQGTPRASGSDLGDAYLACLAPYVDAIVVDKRTHEFLSQSVRRDDSFAKMIGFYIKVPSYRELANALPDRE